MTMDRRDFLKSTSLATTALFIPQFLQGMNLSHSDRTHKKLVVIQLSGGNDGLNTVIPYRNDLYYKMRPSIAINSADVLRVHDELGFHKNLPELASLYENGFLSVINNVGYPNPNRSHFRSMDIWHSASSSDEYVQTGWLGRYLDACCQGEDRGSKLLEINTSLSLANKGLENKGIALKNPEALFKTTRQPFLNDIQDDHHHEKAQYLYKTMAQATSSAAYIFEKSKQYPSKGSYPNSEFGRELKLVAQLINGGADTQVYYISLGGFDTHARQKGMQGRLFKQYGEAIRAFIDDLRWAGNFDNTLIMTFSEFGRRVEQNASGGTDHGAANNLFVIGGNLKKPGFYNDGPDLENLAAGDLKHTIDFRQVYATLLQKWLGSSKSSNVLRGKFNPLNFI